jgi:hypothetical protein
VVGCTTGSKEEVRGERKPVIIDDDDDNENKLKYKTLGMEIQRVWNMKCFVIQVIIGATVIVIKGLERYLETISGKHSTDSL